MNRCNLISQLIISMLLISSPFNFAYHYTDRTTMVESRLNVEIDLSNTDFLATAKKCTEEVCILSMDNHVLVLWRLGAFLMVLLFRKGRVFLTTIHSPPSQHLTKTLKVMMAMSMMMTISVLLSPLPHRREGRYPTQVLKMTIAISVMVVISILLSLILVIVVLVIIQIERQWSWASGRTK